ncbi:MAG TPA: sulfurtransferase [Nocardioidaceae bacterium]|nr:sulfurtransferase [Nocardioidaceae bacterium]
MSPLISAEELAQCLGDVTLLDVRWQLQRTDGHERYLEGHLPGAVYVDLETELADPPHTGSGGRHPLPEADRFSSIMRAHGVSNDRPVVVYDAVGGTSAARAWWLLRYYGHPDVRVLDGGLDAWEGPLEQGPPLAKQGDFQGSPGHLPVLDADDAARVAKEGTLIDARAPERFRGEIEPMDPVPGRVPGAVNVPTALNLENGRFRSADELREIYPCVGEVGVYCGSGVTAAHDVLALAVIGVEAALYVGSYSQWVSDPDRPVEVG